MLLVLGATATLACSSGGDIGPSSREQSQEIIKGFAADSPAFNAVGSLGYFKTDPSTGVSTYQFFCSAALIGPHTVLTAKHCLPTASQFASLGATVLAFGVGPDITRPARLVRIIDGAGAPGTSGGVLGHGPDVAVLYLARDITDIAPLALAVPDDAQIGQSFAVIGYGVQNNDRQAGTRRAGRVGLRALRGKLYEIIFGSFERFREFALTGAGRKPGFTSLRSFESLQLPSAATGALAALAASAGDAGEGPPPDAAPRGEGDGGGADAGSVEPIEASDPVEQQLRALYDDVVLNERYEALVGGGASDAQSCFGDSGGPLLRSEDGRMVVYGVTSAVLDSAALVCDFGAVYATFGPGVLEFVRNAASSVDPCPGLTAAGICDGDIARRCTKPFGQEGPRQLLEFDCSIFGQTCSAQADGTVGCGGL